MTLDFERLRAMNEARELLDELLSMKGPIRKKDLKERIYRVLRHYPEKLWVDKLSALLNTYHSELYGVKKP